MSRGDGINKNLQQKTIAKNSNTKTINCYRQSLHPFVFIFYPHYVVFADVFAVLDLDYLKWDLAGVYQAVRRAFGDKGAFSFVNVNFSAVNDSQSRTSNDYPMLGPVVVILKTKLDN